LRDSIIRLVLPLKQENIGSTVFGVTSRQKR